MRGRVQRFAASLALLASALFAACAAGTAAPEIALRDDNFRPYREYTAGQQIVRAYPNTLATELVARVDRKSGAITTLISADFAYWGRHMRKYESARDARAEALPFEKISRHRSCEHGDCLYHETFTVEIPQGELRRAPPAGYQLKIFARRGDEAVITVPHGDIERLLMAIDQPT
jgi:hypothetical protein